jgi:hypothetical protein
MGNNGNQVIDLGIHRRPTRESEALDLANERIRNLAFQATKLPATLSLSEIEMLGLAVLMHVREHRKIV